MNSNTPTNYRNQPSEDEIDLGKLFEKIGNFFLNLILIFFRNIKVLIAIVSTTIILSLVYYFLQKPVFISEAKISSKFLTTDFCAGLISNLEKFVAEGNYIQLEHTLKLEKGQAEEIKSIKFSYLYDDDKLEDIPDSVLKKSPFRIMVQVDDNAVFDSLGQRIKSYIENNKYAKKREMVEKENIKNEIVLLVSQRKSLDSLKKMAANSLFQPRGDKNGMIFGEPYDPLNIYREEVVFYNKELVLRKKLIESESVEVIQDFTRFKDPARPVKLRTSLLIGIGFGLILSLIFIILKEIGSALRKYELRKSTSVES